jgi:hypothetical protein
LQRDDALWKVSQCQAVLPGCATSSVK